MGASILNEGPMQNQPARVLDNMKPQLVPGDRASNPALPAGDDEYLDAEAFEIEAGGVEPMRVIKSMAGTALKLVIGQRITAARELNGLAQGELAQAMGFANSTQLSLWEQGRRLPPLHLISSLSTNLSVSCDWLLGLCNEPERISAVAGRNALVRRMADLLKRNSQAVADVLLTAGQFDPSPELRATRVCSLVADLCDAVARFRQVNPELFDDARAGALLLRTAKDAREAIDKVATLIDASDRRVEFALKQGRAALNASMPG